MFFIFYRDLTYFSQKLIICNCWLDFFFFFCECPPLSQSGSAPGIASRQLLSLEKCKFFSGVVHSSRKLFIRNWLGFKGGTLPFSYLGVPIFSGKPKKSHMLPIAGRITSKLASWKGILHSPMDRVQLVSSIIHGIIRKIVTITWDELCTPFAVGVNKKLPFKLSIL
ncbi:hypothetical protein AAZX31_17G169900 [Glycine max]